MLHKPERKINETFSLICLFHVSHAALGQQIIDSHFHWWQSNANLISILSFVVRQQLLVCFVLKFHLNSDCMSTLHSTLVHGTHYYRLCCSAILTFSYTYLQIYREFILFHIWYSLCHLINHNNNKKNNNKKWTSLFGYRYILHILKLWLIWWYLSWIFFILFTLNIEH